MGMMTLGQINRRLHELAEEAKQPDADEVTILYETNRLLIDKRAILKRLNGRVVKEFGR
jgi:hypothetical protein